MSLAALKQAKRAQLFSTIADEHDTKVLENIKAQLPVAATTSPASQRGKKRPHPAAPPREGTRRSTRTLNLPPEEKEKVKQEEEEKLQEEIKQRQIAKHAPRDIVTEKSVTGSGDLEQLRDMFMKLSNDRLDHEYNIRGERSPRKAKKESEQSLDGVHLRALVKVVPERIYSLAVHPSGVSDVCFVGDKSGHIGVVVVDPDCSEGKEDEHSRHFYWQAHSGTVSCLKFPPPGTPEAQSTLYSASYDCTVRKTDLLTGHSTEILAIDSLDPNEPLVHAIDFEPDGNVIWCSDNNGGLTRRDLTKPIESAQRWIVDPSGQKVGCFSISPTNPKLGVTSHLKRFIRVWDLGKLAKVPTDGTEEQIEACVLAEQGFEKAATAAYFDSSGSMILASSYDDTIRVYKVPNAMSISAFKGFQPEHSFYHNCQVGRYVSVFKAQWATGGSTRMTLGNMKQSLDVVSVDGTTMKHLTGSSVTSIPAITASHPTREDRYWGGASFGKVQFYSRAA